MAVFNEPQKWAQTLGKDADVTTIPNTAGDTDPSIDKIFPSVFSIPLARGGRAIPRSVLNGLFKLLGDNIFYLQQGGVFSYSDTANYGRGAFVKYNNELYLCIQDNSSLNKHAPTDAKYWLRVALNNDLANYLPLAGGNVTGNLSVQNKNVVRSVNGVNADASGNVSTLPDYSAAVTISSVPYTAPANGLIKAKTIRQTAEDAVEIRFDYANVIRNQLKSYSEISQNALINKGQVITTTIDKNDNILANSRTTLSLTFYPFKVVS